jgi:Flp pilus assembly protein TadD
MTGPQVEVADTDVLAISPDMEAFLERYVLDYANTHTRATLLMNAVSGNGVLGFEYDDAFTVTASEAFEARAGNCIGFANMLVALAREAGLKAEYQEVFRRPEWSTREETVLLVKHINVVLHTTNLTYVMDVSGIRINPNARRRIISDSYAKALYLNNLGADALIRGDLPTAWAYLARAIETEPTLTDSWVNLGVVLGRNEQLQDAAKAYRNALAIDQYDNAALSNLYEIYIAMGDLNSAAQIENKVESYRQKNPYYLLALSQEALVENNFGEAVEFLQRAVRKNKTDHQLYSALANAQYLAGDTEAAALSLLKARELAPENMISHYDRPLDELAAEALVAARAEALAEARKQAARASD